MPLLDHFNPPLNRTYGWRSFHAAWAAAIARLLNGGVLPLGYIAVPSCDRDGPIEIDVATLRNTDGIKPSDDLQLWRPPEPTRSVVLDLPPLDGARVQVITDDGDPRLTAAIELVSPRNKDRPFARESFAAKCADYLRRGSSLVVIDIVTARRFDMHPAILEKLGAEVDDAPPPDGKAVVSYRAVACTEGAIELQIWSERMALGEDLPTVPLWIDDDLSVPLNLELSYRATCQDLRIKMVG